LWGSNSTDPRFETLVQFTTIGEINSTTDEIALNQTFSAILDNGKFNFEQVWELIGRTFYLLYWLYLADLGQTSEIDVFSSKLLPSSNNLFVNEALYQNYLEYYRKPGGILDILGYSPLLWDFNQTFIPLQPIDTTFIQSYSCVQRQLKSGLSFLISIIAADYAFIIGGYTLVLWIASKIQRRRYSRKQPPWFNASDTSRNRRMSGLPL